ncbi:MAG: methionyl-tRNA formyltransferase [Bacilli bacterium]|nr:methionyl-tRNA formyltransferase [Bacilli bacterium]
MNKTKVVFMGTPDFAVPILEGLIENYDVIGVVSQPDKRVGRKQELVNTPIKEVALKNNIPVFQPIKIREEYQEIIDLGADIIVTCAYGQIIPKEILDAPRLGCINVHGSLLPKLRGGAPIHWAIINGEKKTGMTIMYMDVKMDSGDIISQRETEILDTDNLESLYDRMSLIGRDLLLDTLPSIIDGTNSRTKQNEDEVTFGFNVKREEEHIDFNKSCKDVFNLIRGLCPVPGAYAVLDGTEMKVYGAIISDKKSSNKCGEIINIYKHGIGVSCSDGEIILTDIKPFGKKRMDAASYLNGVDKKSLIGKVFE